MGTLIHPPSVKELCRNDLIWVPPLTIRYNGGIGFWCRVVEVGDLPDADGRQAATVNVIEQYTGRHVEQATVLLPVDRLTRMIESGSS